MADPLNDNEHGARKADKLLADRTVPTFDVVTPGGRRARWALLIASLITLGCLVVAIAREHYLKPWRVSQRQFEQLLSAKARAEGKKPPSFPQEIKQITSFSYDIADRCITCHVGIDDPSMADEEQPFRSHPAWVLDIHPPEKFGCTPCHGGQGLATTAEDAHGNVPHWEDPLIPAAYYQAGCGSCHTHLKVSGGSLAEYGARLFERNDCFACHRIHGRGRGAGPDLSTIGVRPRRGEWHERHLTLQQMSRDETWRLSYGPLSPEEIEAIDTYLDQLTGAPKLIEAKATFYNNGCLGCHRVNGVGGDDGADLSLAGMKNAARLDFSRVPGERTLANWHKAHLVAPAEIVPGSQMPASSLGKNELESVTLFLLSLRGADAPMSRWPADRLEAERLGVREFATDGESLFKAFCSACHGSEGMGTRFGISPQAFPSVAHPEFLSVASDRFIKQTLADGRPGRRMPAWGTKDGGLRIEEVDTLVDYLRSKEPSPPSWERVTEVVPDTSLGSRLFLRDCAICHGDNDKGAAAPALFEQVFLRTAKPYFIYSMLANGREDTAMGGYGHYDSTEMAAIVGYIQNRRKGSPLELPKLPSYRSDERGAFVYSRSCASCHGERGEGGLAVNLVNATLLEAASDGFMAAAVQLGRCVPPEGADENITAPEVTAQELADAIEFIRKRAALGTQEPPGRPVSGNAANGEMLFAQTCAGCHGEKGKGGTAPELANAAFQSAATDGYLQATIVRGRASAGMPAFGRDNIGYRRLIDQEVRDIVRYIRTFASDT